jgi:hypothetical protein
MLCEDGRSVSRTTSFWVVLLPDRAWLWPFPCPEAVEGAKPWMVILVAGCRGAVFTVAVEEWSGLVETLETTDDTIERSTVKVLAANISNSGLTLTFLW